MARHEVIFQVHSKSLRPEWNAKSWLDYCRETSPHTDMNPTNNWAEDHCDRLEREQGKPFRFYVEIWN